MRKIRALVALLSIASLHLQAAIQIISPRGFPIAASGGGGGGAITFNAAGSGRSAAASTTLTFSVTITTCTDGYAVVGAGGWDNGVAGSTIASATFDGVSMAALYANTPFAVGVGDNDIRLFGLAIAGKAAGTYNVVVTYSASFEERAAGVTVWDNVHQTTSTGAVPTATTGNSSAPSITATTATGEVVVDNVAWWDGTAAVGANQTSRYNANDAAGGATDDASSSQAGADGGVMSWTLSTAGVWGMQAVSLKPANP